MTTIQRADKSQRTYKRVCMDFASDPRLSWEARGVMAYLLSKSDDWRIIVADLINQADAGRDKVYQILGELATAGYLTRTQGRDERGRVLPVTYALAEVSPLPASPLPANTEAVNSPLPASPYTAPPLPANPTLPKEESTYRRSRPTVEIRERAERNAPVVRTAQAASNTRQSNGEPGQLEQPVRSARNPNPPVPPTPPSPAPAGELAQPRLVETADVDPLAIYREATKVTKPNEAQRTAIRSRVTSRPDLWRATCERFARQGWNVRAVDNLLDAYDKAVTDARRAEARAAAEAAERQRLEDDNPRCTPEQRAENLRRIAERAREIAAAPSKYAAPVPFTGAPRMAPPWRPEP
jgi:hypothetical protein